MNWEIEKGRRYLSQWDTGQRLIFSDARINEVHFAYRKKALVMGVRNENGRQAASVPNICLQETVDLTVFFVRADGESNTTLAMVTIDLLRLPKPDDYVEEPDQILRWESLSRRIEELSLQIGNLEDLNTKEKSSLVVAINEIAEVGGITEETDPTVPAWAKEQTKPTYTAEEVGAATPAYVAQQIAAIPTPDVSVSDIVDSLTSDAADKPLSAAQGKALKGLLDAMVPLPPITEADNGKVLGADNGLPAWVPAQTGGGDGSGNYLRYEIVADAPESYEEGVLYIVQTS